MIEFIILTALMMSIVAISIDAMMPALGIMGGDLGVAYENQTQLIIGFIFIGMTVGQLVCGPLSDAVGRKKVLYGGLVLYIIGSVICYLAQDMTMLLAGRLIQGLGVSGPYVTAVAVVRDKFAGRDMARVMSIVMMIFILVPAIAPTLGQGILMMWSWRAIFMMYIVFAIVLAGWIFLRLPETLRKEDRIAFSMPAIANGFRTVFTNRSTTSYMICMGVLFGSFIGYLNSCQQIFQGLFGVGEEFVLYFGGLALVFGVSSLLNSKIVMTVGMHKICRLSTLWIIGLSAVFLVINLTMLVTLPMFVVYAGLLFLGFGLMFGNINAIAMEPMGHIAGIASAVIGSVSSAISMVIGTTIGQMYDGTLIPVVTGFLVLNIISMGIMAYEKRLSTPVPAA